MKDQCPTESSYLSWNSGFFYTKRGRGVVDCCKLLGVRILWSCISPQMSCRHVPVNLQQNNCYFLFCNFLSLYEWRSVILFKIRASRMGYCVYFRLEATSLYKRRRASMTKHRQQSTRIRARGIESIWSQFCSLLYFHFPINK